MSKQVKVNQRGKSKINFYLLIYHTIKDIEEGKLKKGSPMSYICSKYGIDKQNLRFYSNTLKQLKIIDRVDKKNVYLGWKTLKKLSDDEIMDLIKGKSKKGKSKSSIGTSQSFTKPETNLHAMHIKMPILSGKIDDKDWEIKEKLNHWIPKYTDLPEFDGLKIKNNNNKSISIYPKSRDISNVDDINTLAYKIIFYMGSYFKNKHNVFLDLLNAKVINKDIATEDKHAEGMRGKGEKYLVKFDKTVEKIFPNDNAQSKAMIDGTPYNFSAETNDTDWKREYLNMPFNIRNLMYFMSSINEYTENIKLHMKVMKEIRMYVKELRDLNNGGKNNKK